MHYMKRKEEFALLGLSKKEGEVLEALKGGLNTPLQISRETGVSRTGTYDILKSFQKRGIATQYTQNGRKYWKVAERKNLEYKFFEAKSALLGIPEGAEESLGPADSSVVTHRGKEAVKKILSHIFVEHKNERLYGFQGDLAADYWRKFFTVEEINHINRMIKKNIIITEGIVPYGWFERFTKKWGVGWAKDFEGRATRTHFVDEKYFEHGGQVFIFKNSVYLIALNEEIIIEIRNSDIQKMILSFFRFIQDNSRLVDINALLRDLIAKYDKKV